jgi:hypothetical protein
MKAVYSSPYIVLLSFLSLTYLSLNFVLNFPMSLPLYSPKHVTFLHLYLLTWVLLVSTTFGITYLKPGLGGGYLMSAWNVCVGLSFMMAGIAGDMTARHEEHHAVDDEAYDWMAKTPLKL